GSTSDETRSYQTRYLCAGRPQLAYAHASAGTQRPRHRGAGQAVAPACRARIQDDPLMGADIMTTDMPTAGRTEILPKSLILSDRYQARKKPGQKPLAEL